MTRKKFKETFKQNLIWGERSLNPFVEGHFRGVSGLCLSLYFDKVRLTLNPKLVAQIAAKMYPSIATFPRFDAFVGMVPAAYTFAHQLAIQMVNQKRMEVDVVFAEKKDGSIHIRPSFEDALKEMRVVIVEDVISTGSSVRALIDEVSKWNATVVGVVSIASRMVWTPNVGAYTNLIEIDDVPVVSQECSKCIAGIPHDKVLGHG